MIHINEDQNAAAPGFPSTVGLGPKLRGSSWATSTVPPLETSALVLFEIPESPEALGDTLKATSPQLMLRRSLVTVGLRLKLRGSSSTVSDEPPFQASAHDLLEIPELPAALGDTLQTTSS